MKNYTDFAPQQEEISNIPNKYEQFFFLKSYKCITISSLKKCTPRDRKMNIRFSGSKWALRGKMNQLHCQLYSVIFSSSQQCTVLYACFFLHAVFCLDLDDKSWREEETHGGSYHKPVQSTIMYNQPQKKDKDRRDGKGRRCWLENRIQSIFGHASCFALG